MKTIEDTFVDKSRWPAGVWHDEPDKRQWLDEATGLPCLIVRNPILGNLCGYVGVPRSHPWYGRDAKTINANVHGGLNFSERCSSEPRGVCHKVEPGEDDDVWWLGFDCAHFCDRVPFMVSENARHNRPYRDWAYVEAEVAHLAAQAAAAATN